MKRFVKKSGNKNYSLCIPSEDEFLEMTKHLSDNDIEEKMALLERVSGLDELAAVLRQFGIDLIDEGMDAEGPGPYDTIH